MLTEDMLKSGIWFVAGGNTIENEREYHKELKLLRSENEPEYLAALKGLLKACQHDDRYFAVVSMRWCSTTYRLVTTKRVWLGLYSNTRILKMLSHHSDGSPVYNFAECFGTPIVDEGAWRFRFAHMARTAAAR